MSGKIVKFPIREIEVESPLISSPKARFIAVRINDDAFSGLLRCGRTVIVEEGFIELPGIHAVRLSSGLILIRYALEAEYRRRIPGYQTIHISAANPEYPTLETREDMIIGKVVQVNIDGPSGKVWGRITKEVSDKLFFAFLIEEAARRARA